MKTFIFPLIIMFITSLAMIETLLYASRRSKKPNRSKIRKRIKNMSVGQLGEDDPEILRRKIFSNVPVINKVLMRIQVIKLLERLVRQANAQSPPAVFILLAAVLGLAGYTIAYFGLHNISIALVLGMLFTSFPFLYLSFKKHKRMERFEKQFPEALDLIARSLKAGHAFTSGLRMAAEQFDDPLGTEFEETLEEINFGVSVPEALKNLAGRVENMDLKYFVISVILQRETGGNLSEILESISKLIRERFKFQERLQTLAAEGKLSAIILVCLPFFVLGALAFMNPDYIIILVTDPRGRLAIGIAAIMMVLGGVIMKNTTNIKV